MLEQYTPDQLTAFWTALGALATLAAAVVAIFTLVALRRNSEDRTRPMMSAELRAVPMVEATTELVISNVGQTLAKNVKVTFDPPLPVMTGREAEGKLTPFLQRRYEKPVPTITPGMKLYNIYSSGAPDEPLPDIFTITFSYENQHGRRFQDYFVVSLGLLKMQTTSHPANTDERGMERRRVRALEAIGRGVGRY